MIGIVCVDNKWGISKDGKLLFHNKEDMQFFKSMTIGAAIIYGNNTLKSFPGMKPLKNRLNVVYTRDKNNIPKESIEAADIVYSINHVNHIINGLAPDVDWDIIKGKELYSNYIDEYSNYDMEENIAFDFNDVEKYDKLTILVIVTNLKDAIFVPKLFGYSVDDIYTNPQKGQIYVIGGEHIYNKLIPYCNKLYITKIDEDKNADKFFPNVDDGKWKLDDNRTIISFTNETRVNNESSNIGIYKYTRNIEFSEYDLDFK